jgi:hypothetical protein
MEILIAVVIVAWLPLALGVGAVAQNRGYSFAWFLIALLISAPLALLYLIAMPLKPPKATFGHPKLTEAKP